MSGSRSILCARYSGGVGTLPSVHLSASSVCSSLQKTPSELVLVNTALQHEQGWVNQGVLILLPCSFPYSVIPFLIRHFSVTS